MTDMFCYQCQQTAGNKGCIRTGVCGKQPDTANFQDQLVCRLIRLAETAVRTGRRTRHADRLLADGLFTTLTNVNFHNQAIQDFTKQVRRKSSCWAGQPATPSPSGPGKPIWFPCAPHYCLASKAWRLTPITPAIWATRARRSPTGSTRGCLSWANLTPWRNGWPCWWSLER